MPFENKYFLSRHYAYWRLPYRLSNRVIVNFFDTGSPRPRLALPREHRPTFRGCSIQPASSSSGFSDVAIEALEQQQVIAVPYGVGRFWQPCGGAETFLAAFGTPIAQEADDFASYQGRMVGRQQFARPPPNASASTGAPRPSRVLGSQTLPVAIATRTVCPAESSHDRHFLRNWHSGLAPKDFSVIKVDIRAGTNDPIPWATPIALEILRFTKSCPTRHRVARKAYR